MNPKLKIVSAKKNNETKACNKTSTPTFETGATTHKVNNLILYADNTQKLSETRDLAYTLYYMNTQRHQDFINRLKDFLEKVIIIYQAEKKKDSDLGKGISKKEANEFINIYANRFESWKKEEQRNPTLSFANGY